MTQTVTFYSFKGGVGRTLALANTAYLLAARMQRKVLIWELDLEAPGLLRIPEFAPWAKNAKGGMIDLLLDPAAEPDRLREAVTRAVIDKGDPKVPGLLILPAGMPDSSYGERYAQIDWSRFFGPHTTLGRERFQAIRQALIDVYQPDLILIDSRTGITDIGGICTVILPDTVVLVFNLSMQGFDGVESVKRAIEQQSGPDGLRFQNPIRVLKVASPVPASPPELRQNRINDAKASDMEPGFIVSFEESLLLQEQVATWLGPDVANFDTFERLARSLLRADDGPSHGDELYRNWLDSSTKWMDLPGAPSGPARFELDRLFVPLYVRVGQEIAIADTLQERTLLIEGPAGSGKSTLLRSMARKALQQGRLAVLARLPDIAQSSSWHGSLDPLPRFLASIKFGLTEADWHDRLKQPGTIVFLDGLDEMRYGQSVWDKIAQSMHLYPDCRFWVTSRPLAALGKSAPKTHGFTRVTIEGWDDRAVAAFLANWAACGGIPMEALRTALAANKDLRELARSPLMLTALATVSSESGGIPGQRSRIFARIIDCLGSSRDEHPEYKLPGLERIALDMQSVAGTRATEMEIGDAQLALRRNPGCSLDLEREEARSGLITSNGPRLRFAHLTFQEFLAARALARLDEPKIHEELLRDGRAFRADWRECLLLLAGILASEKGHRTVDRLFDALAHGAGAKLECVIQCAALLGAIVRELMAEGYRPGSEGYAKTLKKLPAMFLAKNAKVANVATRAEAADALGLAGDPRLRLPSDDDYWVRIPGGSFRMGGGGTDQPERKVRVKGFKIGKYPVTVHEYARYVEDSGSSPRDWAQQANHSNRPVNSVTLEEAEAYCRWAGCRLATDAEWEFAARGPAGRVYPWGDGQPREWHANFGDVMHRPIAVGLYPLGSTPEGVVDLAGNAVEWTASGGRRGGDCWSPAAALRAAEIRPRHPDAVGGLRCVREGE